MTITHAAARTAAEADPAEALCDHAGCQTGEPTDPAPLFPGPVGEDLGGPRRPASWGGYGPGAADPAGHDCPTGLDNCCGRCGCQGE